MTIKEKTKKRNLDFVKVKKAITLFQEGFSIDYCANRLKMTEKQTIYIYSKIFNPLESCPILKQPKQYWKDEEEIMRSFSPTYKADELKGDELEIYNGLL